MFLHIDLFSFMLISLIFITFSYTNAEKLSSEHLMIFESKPSDELINKLSSKYSIGRLITLSDSFHILPGQDLIGSDFKTAAIDGTSSREQYTYAFSKRGIWRVWRIHKPSTFLQPCESI